MSMVRALPLPRTLPRPRVATVLLALFWVIFVVYLLGPLLVLSLWSVSRAWFWPSPFPTVYTLDWYKFAQTVPGVLDSLRRSLTVAPIVVVVITLIALPAGYAIARFDFPGKPVIRTLFILPLMVPFISVGVGVATVFYRLHLVGTIPGLVLAHTIVTIPYGVLILTAAFESLDRSIEEAAAACGASPWRCFLTITLPLIAPAILAQAIYVFTISMDEFTLALLISSADTATLPVSIWASITEGYVQISSALSILLLLPSFLLVFVMVRYLKAEHLAMGGV